MENLTTLATELFDLALFVSVTKHYVVALSLSLSLILSLFALIMMQGPRSVHHWGMGFPERDPSHASTSFHSGTRD